MNNFADYFVLLQLSTYRPVVPMVFFPTPNGILPIPQVNGLATYLTWYHDLLVNLLMNSNNPAVQHFIASMQNPPWVNAMIAGWVLHLAEQIGTKPYSQRETIVYFLWLLNEAYPGIVGPVLLSYYQQSKPNNTQINHSINQILNTSYFNGTSPFQGPKPSVTGLGKQK